jgi:hypothetical protein
LGDKIHPMTVLELLKSIYEIHHHLFHDDEYISEVQISFNMWMNYRKILQESDDDYYKTNRTHLSYRMMPIGFDTFLEDDEYSIKRTYRGVRKDSN